MSEMIERVARAIAVADPEQSGQIDDSEMGDYFWEKYREHYMVLARAAIEAMRDPTEAMEDAGNSPTYIWVDETASDVWPRMIDAALKEKP